MKGDEVVECANCITNQSLLPLVRGDGNHNIGKIVAIDCWVARTCTVVEYFINK